MSSSFINGINLPALDEYTQKTIKSAPQAISHYAIEANWVYGTNTKITTLNQKVGDIDIQKNFTFEIDEPEALLGENRFPTPQDYLLGGLAGCMMASFVITAAQKGIEIKSVKLTIAGDLNLHGFLEVDPSAKVGFDEIEYHFEVKGNGTQSDYDDIIQTVRERSPNYHTIQDAVTLKAVSSVHTHNES
ncbi:OsmC family protein [Grimontia sp. NTOU-MAR1]|uniref:OsmC family protein n=1 Tax=Grimontia sp. NTOU-MAR1 TaxID=3111011 RepID=UPI002DBAE5AF|nr:OsmC family protein [Grimontia sp. NTOU-MAR1]WRV98701.1 OsmC family protein [Grimontia sp. NTOU-MAR1]